MIGEGMKYLPPDLVALSNRQHINGAVAMTSAKLSCSVQASCRAEGQSRHRKGAVFAPVEDMKSGHISVLVQFHRCSAAVQRARARMVTAERGGVIEIARRVEDRRPVGMAPSAP